ncbi:hypothetical protein J2W35_004176 [Variovorax boronicumulans]|uniref:EscI/YscI/HrpB family type III secretion system inner rod protein n=1 Tax=Variovorax boronicumulans TaxID=436515 RepID=UPI002788830C|nr:EscI/YscI/HrpB family type III secretion system inner rod protein [Variovorax boronicumulans]MDQ0083810.1 hypothetical protein [Variovorax boronicumulans]
MTSAVSSIRALGRGDAVQGQHAATDFNGPGAIGPALPRLDDVRDFNQILAALDGSSMLTPARSGGAPPAGPLGAVSAYLSKRGTEMAELFEGTVRSRDPQSMLKATVKMTDASLENELLAKVIGKTVSGIEQLTKLS